MATKTFYEAFSAIIGDQDVAKKSGLSYIAAATAMRLAGRPTVEFVDFDGKPHLEMLNGSVVAVDITIPETEKKQRMWLPVMDRDNLPLAIGETKLTDINNNRQRCLVKAIAAVFGDGMSLYLNCDGDGTKAAKLLNVSPDTDLEVATPVIATLKEGGAPYIEWGVGLAACRITDPSFHWSVVEYDGLPFRNILGGIWVEVETVYEGFGQRVSLPIMDAAFNPTPAEKATVSDWNKTVMRALTKCIAFNTGYGLSVYAEEFGAEKDAKATKGSTAKATAAKGTTKGDASANADAKAKAEAPATTEAKAAAVNEQPAATAKAEVPTEASTPATDTAAKADATPAADAQPQGKSEPAKESASSAPAGEGTKSAEPAGDSEAVDRFKGVMKKRREKDGFPGILSLFLALKTSDKFKEEDKPACFAVLVNSSAAVVDEATITALLDHIREYSAMQYVSADNRDGIAGKLTAVALAAALPHGDDALANVPGDLVAAGIAADVADVMRLTVVGLVPRETQDLLADVLDKAPA